MILPDLDTLRRRLEGHVPARLTIQRPGWRRAAVLIPLLPCYELVFIRRSPRLRKHAGQIAFPGGGLEEQDTSLLATALREAEEEIGLASNAVTVLGRVDEVWTPTGYTLTPFVGLVPEVRFVPCPTEVAEVLRVKVSDLIAPGVFRTEVWARDGKEYRVVFFELPQLTIWGATGRILETLLRVGFGWSQSLESA